VVRGDRWGPSRARRIAGVVPSCGRFYKLESEYSVTLTWCLIGSTAELEKCRVAHVSSWVSARMGLVQTFLAWSLVPLTKRVLQRLRYIASALKLLYIFFFLSSSCSCLRHLPCHLFLSSFPSIIRFRRRCVIACVCLNAWGGINWMGYCSSYIPDMTCQIIVQLFMRRRIKARCFCMHRLLWRENYSAVFFTHCILCGFCKLQRLFLYRMLTGLCNEYCIILQSNAW
jgi:hypothetical protein